uniref:Uncharacterized protein n=1 Tax=Globisporangium ultimum (strain ATCC 200006 / CBS 805.95 / DAOM BR144) TaxID=431595 RepID=K3WJB8_GLOUD
MSRVYGEWVHVISAKVKPATRKHERAYSANRVFALHEYCASVSIWRVLSILVLYSAPGLTLVLIFDAIPLQDPREGWRANVTFWIRQGVSTFFICAGVLLQSTLAIQDFSLTAGQISMISLGVGIGCVVTVMLIAALWMFPLPFTQAFAGVPLFIFLNTLVSITLGLSNKELLAKFVDYMKILNVQAMMMVMYPVYTAAFLVLDEVGKLAFVLLLRPLLKKFLKYVSTKVSATDDDLVASCSSSVNIFHAVYMSKCMQSAGTLKVSLAIIAVDIVQNVWAIRRLAKHAEAVREVCRGGGVTVQMHDSQTLLPFVFQLVHKSNHLSPSTLRLGSLNFAVSNKVSQELRRLDAMIVQEATIQVFPSEQLFRTSVAPSLAPQLVERTQEEAIIREAVVLLYASETIAMVEYTEAVVPIIYAVYISILFQLPNARYCQDMDGFTAEKLRAVVTNILAYGSMELLSLLYMERKIRQQFGVSACYQLAFALENEWKFYQTQFFIWTLVVFEFSLAHTGVDFSFQFKWNSNEH